MGAESDDDANELTVTAAHAVQNGAEPLDLLQVDKPQQGPTKISTILTKPILGDDAPAVTRNNDCIVVIYTKEPTLLGKRFVIDFTPARIGRGAENHIVLDGDSVSRRHVHLEQRGSEWWAVDDGSTNGTYVNDQLISREVSLVNGDRIKVGPTIFKYLSGTDVEAQYHEEIYRITIIDGLTQAYVKRYLLEELEKSIMQARLYAFDLSLMIFDIDHFKKINDHHGHLAGDFVLKELAGIVQGRIRRHEVFARYGGEEFAVMLPHTNLEGARALAEGLREKIAENRFEFQGDSIQVTISVGVAMLSDTDTTPLALIASADAKLYEAKRTGRNRVVSAIGGTVRRHVEAAAAIARCPGGVVVALELADEAGIRHRRGSAGYEALFNELAFTVDRLASPDDVLATWQDRVLFIVRPSSRVSTAEGLAALVEGSFHATVEDAPLLNRVVVSASVLKDIAPITAVDRVLAQLLALRQILPPVPLALVGKVDSRPTSESRCTGLRNALEVGLAYLVALELAAIRNAGNLDQLVKVLEPQKGLLSRDLSLGAWRQLADSLAAIVPAGTVVFDAARGLRDAGAKMTPAGRAIEAAVHVRNQVTHGAGRDPNAYADEEQVLRAGVDALLAILAPVARLPLVAFTDGVELLDDDSTVYPFADLHGLSGTYARRTATLTWRLRKNWCYVLVANEKPLLLAPIFFAKVCTDCGELEVAWVRHISVGERGASVRGVGLLTDHPLDVALPANEPSERLANLLRS